MKSPLEEQLKAFFESVYNTAEVYMELHENTDVLSAGELVEFYEKIQQVYGLAYGAERLAEGLGWTRYVRLISRARLFLEARLKRVKRELRIRGLL